MLLNCRKLTINVQHLSEMYAVVCFVCSNQLQHSMYEELVTLSS